MAASLFSRCAATPADRTQSAHRSEADGARFTPAVIPAKAGIWARGWPAAGDLAFAGGDALTDFAAIHLAARAVSVAGGAIALQLGAQAERDTIAGRLQISSLIWTSEPADLPRN